MLQKIKWAISNWLNGGLIHPGDLRERMSAPPVCSMPIPEPTPLQAKKARYLMGKGGQIAQPRIEVVMPDGSVARIDSHGRVYWGS